MSDFISRAGLLGYLSKKTAEKDYTTSDMLSDIERYGIDGEVTQAPKLPEEFSVLKNIRDYSCWDFKHYPLTKAEAETIKKCMAELKKYRDSGLTAEQLAQVDEEYLKVIQKVPRWRKCSEELPEDSFGCLVIVVNTNPMTMKDFKDLLPYFVGYDKESGTWNDGDGEQCPFEVVKWMPLPEWEGEL